MEPLSVTRCSLFLISVVFLLPRPLSGWELIWETQLLLDRPQRSPSHNKHSKKLLSAVGLFVLAVMKYSASPNQCTSIKGDGLAGALEDESICWIHAGVFLSHILV